MADKPTVLTAASTFSCGTGDHNGTMSPSTVDYFTIGGKAVVTSDTLAATHIDGCGHMVGQTKTPCTTLSSPSAGTSAALTAGGSAVALSSFAAKTLPNAISLQVTANDDLLTAD
jgi:hypothetical protein